MSSTLTPALDKKGRRTKSNKSPLSSQTLLYTSSLIQGRSNLVDFSFSTGTPRPIGEKKKKTFCYYTASNDWIEKVLLWDAFRVWT